jgi:RimJ/RimL family protein N-acetyltransferase
MTILEDRVQQIKEQGDNDIIRIKHGKNTITLRNLEMSKENIQLLTKWRKKYMYSFGSKFEPSEERTEKWLKKQIIEKSDRILFLVMYNNKKIGHIGLFNFNKDSNSYELDNVLRGRKIGPHNIMEIALRTILQLVFEYFKLSKIQLKVFSDNYKAINLYERSGLLTIKSSPVKRFFVKDGWDWREVKHKKNILPERFFSIMEITKQDFRNKINLEKKLGYRIHIDNDFKDNMILD